MKLMSIARTVQKLNYKTNQQNYATWNAMSEYFDEIYLLVQSPDNRSHYEKVGKIKVYWIPDQGCFRFNRVFFMIEAFHLGGKLIKENHIDVLNLAEPVVSGIPGVWLKYKYQIPLVTQIQGQLLALPKGTFSKLKTIYITVITKYVCKRSDKVRAVSLDIAKELWRQGISQDKVCIVPSRCDTEKFCRKRYEEDRARIRCKLGYSDENIVIGFTGRVVAYRNIEHNLITLKLLLEKNRLYRLLIVGDGDDRKRLESLSKEMGLDKRVIFYGRVPFEEIPQFLSAIDIFISTPGNEGMSRSNLEAMSMELPIVVTNVGGNTEIVNNGVDGLLVEVGEPEQAANRILEYLDTPEKRRLMGNRARKHVMEEYEYNKLIKQFAEIHWNF